MPRANGTRTKRKQPMEEAERLQKKARTTNDDTLDSASVNELARPYLLAVSKLPLDMLSTTWSAGINRPIERRHVRELREAFRVNGVQRREPANRILCLCSAEDVQRAELPASGQDNEADLTHWVRRGGTVEVMAGQHRIAALREHIRASGGGKNELWWTCELYDRDRLPKSMAMRMRLNRTDLTMPDSHGQIWTQLVSITSGDGGTGEYDQPEGPIAVDHKLVKSLWLGSEQRFPTQRLVTLWCHERWRSMTTRWCRTRMGLGSLSISMFEWMASHRLDDYWFGLLDSTLDALRALPLDTSLHVTHRDWDRLAAALSEGDEEVERSRADVEMVFYGSKLPGAPRHRVGGLLTSLDDDEYGRFCQFIADTPSIRFPAPHRIKRAYMQYMAHIIYHVIAWFDPPSAAVASAPARTQQNKTLLRVHLEEALKSYHSTHQERSSPTLPPSFSAETAALHLQYAVLDFVRRNGSAFQDCPIQPAALDQMLGVDDPTYAGRFRHDVWSRLLTLVRREAAVLGIVGVLREEWMPERAAGAGSAMPGLSGTARVSSLIMDFCRQVTQTSTTASLSPGAAASLEQSIQDAVERTVQSFLSSGDDDNGEIRGAQPRPNDPGLESASPTATGDDAGSFGRVPLVGQEASLSSSPAAATSSPLGKAPAASLPVPRKAEPSRGGARRPLPRWAQGPKARLG